MKSSSNMSFIINLFLLVVLLLIISCQTESDSKLEPPFIKANSDLEAGRYIVIMGGCNDCHTDGYAQKDGMVNEEEWLTGSIVGYRGPWGTTYASNLRLIVQELSEEQWVKTMHTRKGLPPMPWMNVNKFNEKDTRALYRYIKSLGQKGQKMPQVVTPDKEPTTPYINMIPGNI